MPANVLVVRAGVALDPVLEMELSPGCTIGPYVLREKLAQGGMGAVWRAQDAVLEREVAIKFLLPKEDPEVAKEIVARFLIEAKAAAAIKSRHVVQVLSFGRDDDGREYMVMELVKGKTLLATLMRERRLGVERAVRIARDVARGLRAAHALNIIHRDLKPANVMLTRDEDGTEVAKLLDFGVAKRLQSSDVALTAKGQVYGTLLYMAPEQIDNTNVDHRADVYAVGCLLFRMLTGRDLFEASGMAALAMQIIADVPPPPSKYVVVPASLDDVVMRCLAKRREDRFQSMAELDAALSAIDSPQADTTASVDPPTGPTQTINAAAVIAPQTARSRPVASLALMFLLGALVAAAMIRLSGAWKEQELAPALPAPTQRSAAPERPSVVEQPAEEAQPERPPAAKRAPRSPEDQGFIRVRTGATDQQ